MKDRHINRKERYTVNKMQMPLGRYVAVENSSVDGLNSVLDIGLLVYLLRQPPGMEVTVEGIARNYREGRKVLTDSMRRLVDAGHVVKLRIQSFNGNWRTEMTAAHVPLTVKQVERMVNDMQDVKTFQVEPAWLDPRGEERSAPKNNVFELRAVSD